MGGLIAGGMALVSGLNQAYDANQEAKRASLEAADNQRLAETAASDAIARGSREAALIRMRGGQMLAKQRLAYANSGVDASTGTPAKVGMDTASMTELDAKTAENNAAAEAWGFKRYGLKYGQQAQLEAARGASRATGAVLGGIGRFAPAAADFFSKQYFSGGD